MTSYLTGLDWLIILLYFGVIAGISWWAVKKKDKTSADDYFLAGRHLGWFVVGASIFASNIGSEHLVGLARLRAIELSYTRKRVGKDNNKLPEPASRATGGFIPAKRSRRSISHSISKTFRTRS